MFAEGSHTPSCLYFGISFKSLLLVSLNLIFFMQVNFINEQSIPLSSYCTTNILVDILYYGYLSKNINFALIK